ncbi:MAG: phycocyanin alpha phycocyanobilin lyase [Dehalococcoidia bacterium]|nr:phycocyanin alpha phycocyanobilin lyase [Dehalococcoidia bacterium]
MTIRSYLAELADEGRPPAVAQLKNLSSLASADLSALRELWPSIPAPRRAHVVQRLVELGEENVDLDYSAVFLSVLDDLDPSVRLSAMQGLWEYEGRDLIDPLLALLRDDEEPGIRAGAALLLGQYEYRAEFDDLRQADVSRIDAALIATVQDEDSSIEVRARALEAVSVRTIPVVRDLIEDAYESGNQRLRISAIHAMGRNCDPDWLPFLFDDLADDDPEVRCEAAIACGSIADDAATEELLPLLDDEDVDVHVAAISALGAIGGPQAAQALRTHDSGGNEAIRQAIEDALDEIQQIQNVFDFGLN